MLPLPKRGKVGIWQNPDMGKGGGEDIERGNGAAGQGGQDFCARENCVFPKIEDRNSGPPADQKQGEGRNGQG